MNLDSSGPIRSPNVTGTPRTRKKINRAKGQKKKLITERRQREERDAMAAANASYHAAIACAASEQALGNAYEEHFALSRAAEVPNSPIQPRKEVLDGVLATLKANGLSWGDLVMYVSDPASKRGSERFHGLFEDPVRVAHVLDLWTSSRNSQTARTTIHGWVMQYIKSFISSEGNRATEDAASTTRCASSFR